MPEEPFSGERLRALGKHLCHALLRLQATGLFLGDVRLKAVYWNCYSHEAKVGRFALARRSSGEQATDVHPYVGSYRAPEPFNNGQVTEKTESWAVASLAFFWGISGSLFVNTNLKR